MTTKGTPPPGPPRDKPLPKPRPKAKTSPTPEAEPGEVSTAYDIQKAEKRVVVYVEIGENLQKTLDKALTCAYNSDENIGETMSEMGVNIKTMVESAVKMEISAQDASGNKTSGRRVSIKRG